ncbi:MAG: MtrB/PioB family decaheme-associated outer membrane protein [Sulfuritalea sp.]|jgi:MtrB/PioB family decaheme-associated outer membrane protein|nr:MtrB/PioB family decaheme-associated outer membrane protein [Sulfuritalea sp.]
MANKLPVPVQRRTLALAICSALSAMASPAYADQGLDFNLFRDSATMFRDADMSRWSENYVELGVGYNSRSSLKFGEYSGLTDKGGFPLAGFNWLNRDAGNDAQFWRVYGANLGLDSRKLQAEGGVQGKWGVTFSLDQLKKSQTESAVFLHDGLGTNTLTLPVAYTRVANSTLVNPSLLKPFEIEQGRDVYRLGLNGELANGWSYKLSFREDQSDGTRLTGLNQGFAGVIVPYPIDERTRQIEATLSYATKVAQLQIGYTYSKFDNSLHQFDVQNLITSATVPNLRLSLAPSNDFHQFNANGGYNISKVSRLSGKFSYGIARQNEGFLPYSANGTAATAALPRSSLDGKVVNTLLDLALTTKPVDKMNLKLGYQYRDNDNRTPIANFIYAASDGATVAAVNSGSDRTNAPVRTTEQRVLAEADYEIAERTTLRAGLERSHKTYTLSDRNMTDTDKLSLEIRRPVSDELLGSVGYVFTRRTGSEYDANRFFRETHAAGYRAGTTTTGIPSLRSYMYSDYDENRLRASGNWTVSETVSLQGGVDDYRQRSRGPDCSSVADARVAAAIGVAMPDTCLGRKLADGVAVNLDLQWQPEENLMTFTFANFAQTKTDQAGRTTSTVPQGADPARDYSVASTYQDATVGLGLKWQPEEQWDLGGTYVYQQGTGLTNVASGSGVVPAAKPLPDLTTRLHSLQLYAKLAYSKQLSWRFNYIYENLKSSDWSYDVLGPTAVSGVLQTGQTPPRYSNHVFGVSAIVRSW